MADEEQVLCSVPHIYLVWSASCASYRFVLMSFDSRIFFPYPEILLFSVWWGVEGRSRIFIAPHLHHLIVWVDWHTFFYVFYSKYVSWRYYAHIFMKLQMLSREEKQRRPWCSSKMPQTPSTNVSSSSSGEIPHTPNFLQLQPWQNWWQEIHRQFLFSRELTWVS